MGNNQQSSVDFYAEKSLDLFNLFQQGSISINDFRARMFIIEIEAKAIHKEEIINATIYGDRFEGCYGLDSEQYYNRTYGGNNEQK